MKHFLILLIVLAGAAGLIAQRLRPQPAEEPWEPGFSEWMCWFLETITRPEETR